MLVKQATGAAITTPMLKGTSSLESDLRTFPFVTQASETGPKSSTRQQNLNESFFYLKQRADHS